ncbi:Cbb3-type cytochrome oxidase component FixQ [Gracilimonas mengyeensis]|uniref:Cbb3-type cytochrome oxidase component FixQ n=2 Tax=Gracilimonas mengyeensis TaxID=1302730 RepID=A0A521BE49_9BACT|nr:Cbb3-type cytochrome oxidase component FixQ [Gracilimonas mengyeensis]
MEDIGIYPSISLILFFGFFVGLIIYLMVKGKHHWDDAAHLPLEDDDNMNFKHSNQ